MAQHDRVAALAAAILDFRRLRIRHLPADFFAEAPYELLLALFVADADGRKISGRDFADKSSMSKSVMSRWLKYLSDLGLIVGDGTGDLDDELTLSGRGFEAIEALLLEGRSLVDQYAT